MQLKDLYPKLSTAQRAALAEKAGIKAPFLWQIATQWGGKKPSMKTLLKLAEADKRLRLADLAKEFSAEA